MSRRSTINGCQTGGARLLLPQLTLLKLWDTDGSRYENQIEYSACRVFGSESVFRPDFEAGGMSPAARVEAKAPVAIPPGLIVQIALRSRIDGEKAFAGDAVEGRLVEAVRGKDGSVLAPRGAKVNGRILRLEQHVQPSIYLVVGLRFHSVEAGGVEVPLRLEAIARTRGDELLTGAREKRAGIGMFLVQRQWPILDAGFVSEWKTRGE